jgi:uncharacterized membrane protein YtjA (UPF0391 family)
LFFSAFRVSHEHAQRHFRNLCGGPGFFLGKRRWRRKGYSQKGNDMLGWAVTFLIVALIAAMFGFGGIAGVAVEAAKIVFFVAIVLFAISAMVGLLRGRSPTVP